MIFTEQSLEFSNLLMDHIKKMVRKKCISDHGKVVIHSLSLEAQTGFTADAGSSLH